MIAVLIIWILSFYKNSTTKVISSDKKQQVAPKVDTAAVIIIEDRGGDTYNIIYKTKINNCDVMDAVEQVVTCKRL